MKVLQGARLFAGNGRRSPQAVMYAGSEDAGEELFAYAPVLGKADVLPGFVDLVGLQPTSSGQQGEFGAVGVVLQGVAVELGEALPVAELPLGAGAFEEVFVVGDGVGRHAASFTRVLSVERGGGFIFMLCF